MKIEVFDNAFDAIADSPFEAAILKLKSALFIELEQLVKKKELSRRDLEKLWDLPQPRVSEIMTAKFNKVSVEKLVQCLILLGAEIDPKIIVRLPEAG